MELQNRGIRVEVAFLLGIGEGQKCVKKMDLFISTREKF